MGRLGPPASVRPATGAAGGLPPMSELDRALRFVHGLAETAVTEVARDGPLTVLRTPELSLVWDANHLRVVGATGADARALAASAAQRGVPSMVVVPDASEGERLAACCRLLAGDGIGQVEDVGTAPAARRQGLARAVVAAATAASHAAGHELTFLNCDADGWVSDFYASLGFEPIGVVHNFHRA